MMPVHICGIAKPRWNCTIAAPRPRFAPNSSLITMRMTPMDSAWRAPVATRGLDPRSTIRNVATRPSRYERAVSRHTSSMERTPSTAFSRIGHRQPSAIVITLAVEPV
jgi:hypothetical protein